MTLFVPAVYDLVWTVAVLLHLALLVTALTLWFRDRREGIGGVLEALVIVAVPVIGAVTYLIARSLSRRAPLADSP